MSLKLLLKEIRDPYIRENFKRILNELENEKNANLGVAKDWSLYCGAGCATITLVDTSNSNFIYIGSASPGTATSDSTWQIQRVDLRTAEIQILYADSNDSFDNVWDDRVGLTYG